MKKVQKSKDLKDESQGQHSPKWLHDKPDLNVSHEDEQHQVIIRGDGAKDKRKQSTKSSPDSRQRSSERICNSNNPRNAVKTTNSTKRVAQMTTKTGKQLNELMKPKRKLIQRGQVQTQRNTKSQPNTRSTRNAASNFDRQTRINSSTYVNYDIEEKNKNKSLPAGAHPVDFTVRKHSRSHPKRPSRLIDSTDDEHAKGQNSNGFISDYAR